jgi:suppressor of ftsI/bilirubin oxidase
MGVRVNSVQVDLTSTPFLKAQNRVYRFRLLNTSNTRIFRLSRARLTDGETLAYHVVATDGSLLDRLRAVHELFLDRDRSTAAIPRYRRAGGASSP